MNSNSNYRLEQLIHDKQLKLAERLKQFPSFSRLYYEIAVRAKLGNYKKNSVLYNEDTASSSAYLILSGTVNLVKNTLEGRSISFEVQAGQWVGLPEVVLRSNYFTEAIVREQSEIISLSNKSITNLLQIPEFSANVVQDVANYHSQLLDYLYLLAMHSTRDRLIIYLYNYIINSPPNSNHIKISKTHEEISQIINAERISVSRFLGSLKRLGLIETEITKITILQPDKIIELYNGMN